MFPSGGFAQTAPARGLAPAEAGSPGEVARAETPPDARAFLPDRLSLAGLRRAAAGCTACPLHETGTRTVFGRGLVRSRLMLVGEQPGDEEDLEGRPFVGPAGRLLDEALVASGIERDEAYVTNAVKHFKWKERRGKRRIHDKPSRGEVKSCLPWLAAEVEVVAPEVVVCLGATAARALLGPAVRVGRDRGRVLEAVPPPDVGARSLEAPAYTVTAHPSAVLRAPDHDARRRGREELVADLRFAAELLAGPRG